MCSSWAQLDRLATQPRMKIFPRRLLSHAPTRRIRTDFPKVFVGFAGGRRGTWSRTARHRHGDGNESRMDLQLPRAASSTLSSGDNSVRRRLADSDNELLARLTEKLPRRAVGIDPAQHIGRQRARRPGTAPLDRLDTASVVPLQVDPGQVPLPLVPTTGNWPQLQGERVRSEPREGDTRCSRPPHERPTAEG